MTLVTNYHFLASHQPKKLLFFLKQNLFKSLIIKDAGETSGVSRQAQNGYWHWPMAIRYNPHDTPEQKAILSKLPVVPEYTSLYNRSSRPNSKNKTWDLILFVFREHLQGSKARSGSENLHGLLAFTILHLQLPWPGMLTETRRKSPYSLEEIIRKPSVPYLSGWNFFPGTKSESKDWFL